jgi:hypothetical protein
MRNLICAAAIALAAGTAMAGEAVATNGRDYVRITEKPCADPVLSLIPVDAQEHFRAAVAFIGGKEFRACWALRPDGVVFLHFEDGDAGLIPGHQFRVAPGV